MPFRRTFSTSLFAFKLFPFVLVLVLLVPSQQSMAQKRSSKLKSNPANTLEAAAMEFALSADQVNELVGKKADVLTSKGKLEKNVEITRFFTGRNKSHVKSIEFKVENVTKPKRLAATRIVEIKVDGKTYLFNYIPSLRAAMLEDQEKKKAAITDKLVSSNQQFWEELSEEEQAKYVDEYKEFLTEVGTHFSTLKMKFYETKYFLFYSDMPAKQVAPYLVQLDKMNELLGQSFGFKPGYNIWRGKAVIVAFVAKPAFLEFEKKFYNRSAIQTGNAIGLCHSHGDGKVIVSCYRGDDPNFFGAVLVHETAHGYMHRYRTTVHIPTWINEGIADWIAMIVVPSSKEVKFRQTQAAARLRQMQTFGGQFFESDRLESWQYGSASAIIQLMLKASPAQFKLFFNGIKDGLTWQDSLLRAYGISVEQLSQAYGQSIGIPRLTP